MPAQTLTALQQARLEVGAFPCLPDAMTVCGLLADQMAGKPIPNVAGRAAAREQGGPAPEERDSKRGGETSVRARSL